MSHWHSWRPLRGDALMVLIVGVFAIVGPDGFLRNCATGLVTLLAAAATQLRYWENRIRRVQDE